MDKVVITIARQYGSGGRTIGQMLSENMGIPYYDKELLKFASEESGINETLFVGADEKLQNSPLLRISQKVYQGQLISPASKDFTSPENLFNYQAKVIKQLAEEESCIIIGRCADYVLKDYDNVISVFVHAPEDYCIEQAKKKLSMSERDIKKFIQKTDKERADYYKHYTGREWTDARNYDLCINSSKMEWEQCVEEIKAYIKVRFGTV